MRVRWRTRASRATVAAWPLVWAALLTAAVIGPMARGGWVMTLDWVTGPRVSYWQHVGDRASLPAGPLFFLVAATLQGMFGAAVGWLMPAGSLLLAGWAASRLPTTVAGRAASATAAIWNPFVHERLYAGQVAILAGYGVLFALVGSARRDQGSSRRRVLHLGLWWAAAAACSVQFALLGGAVLVAFGWSSAGPQVRPVAVRLRTGEGVGRRWTQHCFGPLFGAAALATAITLGWLLAARGAPPSAGTGATVTAFATRADDRWGLAVGTWLQRGFWRPSLAGPGLWGTRVWDTAALVVPALAAVGWGCMWRTERRRAVAVAVVGVTAWVLSWGTSGPLGGLYRAMVITLPGAGTFREAGKFLAIGALLGAVLIGVAVDRWVLLRRAVLARSVDERSPGALRRRVASDGLTVGSCAALVLVPVLSTPSLAGGVQGHLAAVRYPAGWQAARALVEGAGAQPGSVLIVPQWTYLDPGFTGGRVVANPASAYFGSVARTGDDPHVPGLAPSAEALAAQAALDSADVDTALAALGIEWVLVLRTDAALGLPTEDLELVLEQGNLMLWRRAPATDDPASAALRQRTGGTITS